MLYRKRFNHQKREVQNWQIGAETTKICLDLEWRTKKSKSRKTFKSGN
jgi:hypothetical protein